MQFGLQSMREWDNATNTGECRTLLRIICAIKWLKPLLLFPLLVSVWQWLPFSFCRSVPALQLRSSTPETTRRPTLTDPGSRCIWGETIAMVQQRHAEVAIVLHRGSPSESSFENSYQEPCQVLFLCLKTPDKNDLQAPSTNLLHNALGVRTPSPHATAAALDPAENLGCIISWMLQLLWRNKVRFSEQSLS